MKFGDFHPITLIIFFVSVITFTMITMNPCLLLISFSGAFASVALINKKTNIKAYLLLFVVIAITNPIFSHNGESVMFYLFDQRITFEAFVYGVFSAILITGIMYWCRLFSAVFREDKLAWLIGSLSPKLCVVFCMALRFVPLFKENAKNIYNTQMSMGIFNTSTLWGKLKLAENVLSALVSLSIESAVETADTMRARGFENKKRSSYSPVVFKRSDFAVISAVLVSDTVIFLLLIFQNVDFYYYPTMRFASQSHSVAVYAMFILLCFIPPIWEIKESLKWKYLTSKI